MEAPAITESSTWRLALSDYDVLHQVFNYFKTPYDEGVHNGNMLLSFMLVNKVWCSVVEEQLWSRLKTDRALWRILMLDYAMPQGGGRLSLAKCSWKKIRLNRVSLASLLRFRHYASLVVLLDESRDDVEAKSVTEREIRMWKTIVDCLDGPVFPRLRYLKFFVTPKWTIPGLYTGSSIKNITMSFGAPDVVSPINGQLIQDVLDRFPSIETFFLESWSTYSSDLRSICGPFNGHQKMRELSIQIFRRDDDYLKIYDALQDLKLPYSLTFREPPRTSGNLERSEFPALPSLYELVFMTRRAETPEAFIAPRAPNLKTLKIISAEQYAAHSEDLYIDSVVDYQRYAPFTTLVYRCDDGRYNTVLTDRPNSLLRLKNLTCLELSFGCTAILSESFLNSLTEGSPGLITLKSISPSYRYLYYTQETEQLLEQSNPLVTLHGILRVVHRLPHLQCLHMTIEGRSSHNTSLWTRSTLDDNASSTSQDSSDRKGDLSIVPIEPHYNLQEFDTNESHMDDAEAIVTVLKLAFPSLASVGYYNQWSPWNEVNSRLHPEPETT